MRISDQNRDALARIAREEMHGASLDEALASLLFEHAAHRAFERLMTDPAAYAHYLAQGRLTAEVDVAIRDDRFDGSDRLEVRD